MNTKTGNTASRWFIKLCLLAWAVGVLYPMIWTILSSLKDNEQFILGKPWNLPKLPLLWSNFSYIWERYSFGDYFINSLVITVISTLVAAFLSASTAYVIARYPFRGNGVLFYSYLSYMMIPAFLGIIPLFFLMDDLHLTNQLLGLILIYTITSIPFAVFVLVGFFKQLPKELEESAAIDGASHFGTFFRIMLPLVKPGLVSVSIITVLNIWNEYIFALVLVNDPTKYTIPVAIAVMQAEMQYRTEWGPLFAALFVSMGPVLLFYMIFQRQITGGITAGAVKG
jgi:N-acetylglucosamine transport system permease protein